MYVVEAREEVEAVEGDKPALRRLLEVRQGAQAAVPMCVTAGRGALLSPALVRPAVPWTSAALAGRRRPCNPAPSPGCIPVIACKAAAPPGAAPRPRPASSFTCSLQPRSLCLHRHAACRPTAHWSSASSIGSGSDAFRFRCVPDFPADLVSHNHRLQANRALEQRCTGELSAAFRAGDLDRAAELTTQLRYLIRIQEAIIDKL